MALVLCTTAGPSCEAVFPWGAAPEQQPSLVLGFTPERPPWLDDDPDASLDRVPKNTAPQGEHPVSSQATAREHASADTSAKADWIRRASAVIPERFSRVDAFMWFHFDKERNWRIDSSPEALQAFRQSWAGLAAGVFLPDFPGPGAPHTSAIDAYEAITGVHQARIGWHLALTAPFPTEAVLAVQQRGSIPYLVWEPYDPRTAGETARTGESRLDDILAGAYDAFIDRWAEAAAAIGGAIEITFGHEMNGDWYTWGCADGHNGNTPELFVQAYRYVHDRFEAAGAGNVRWVWTINASWHDDFTAAFPGQEYVDRLGINGFNFGGDPETESDDWLAWREFEQIFGCWNPDLPSCFNSYETLAALADRPVIIGEFASAERGAEPTGTD